MQYRTKEGDVLDAICWRYYGHQTALAVVLAANFGLADAGALLPGGLIIELPAIALPLVSNAVKLWD